MDERSGHHFFACGRRRGRAVPRVMLVVWRWRVRRLRNRIICQVADPVFECLDDFTGEAGLALLFQQGEGEFLDTGLEVHQPGFELLNAVL